MKSTLSGILLLLLISLVLSCRNDKNVQYEEITHEKGQKGGISTGELQKLYKELNILEKKLSGENEDFNEDIQKTLNDLEEIPVQLRRLLEQVEGLSEN